MTVFSIAEQVLAKTTAILRLVRARPGSIWTKHSCCFQVRPLSVSKGWRMRLVQFLTDDDQNGVRVGIEEKDGGNVIDLNLFDSSLPRTMKEFLEKGETAMETARRAPVSLKPGGANDDNQKQNTVDAGNLKSKQKMLERLNRFRLIYLVRWSIFLTSGQNVGGSRGGLLEMGLLCGEAAD